MSLLVGALIICKKGTFVNNKHKDIDKDFVLLLTVTDENQSWLLDRNIAEFCPQFNSTKKDDDFQESNKMHVINGYFYANTPGLEMCSGDRVDWHVFALGGEVDIHTGMCTSAWDFVLCTGILFYTLRTMFCIL